MRSSSAYSRRRRLATPVPMIQLCRRRGEVYSGGMMFFQQFRCMFQSRTLRRPRPRMGARNGMIELNNALVIAVRHILLIPAAAGRAGAGRGKKAGHRRLGSVAKVLFRVLRGDV